MTTKTATDKKTKFSQRQCDLLNTSGTTEDFRFFRKPNIIYIPRKINKFLDTLNESQLISIDSNIDVAKDYIRIFLSKFAHSFFIYQPNFIDDSLFSEIELKDNTDGVLNMSQRRLCETIFGNYNGANCIKLKQIICILTCSDDRYKYDPIIVVNKIINLESIDGKVSQNSFAYKLTNNYIKYGFTSYEVKSEKVLKIMERNYYRHLSSLMDNIICKNIIRTYSMLELPTLEQVEKEAARLVKEGYTHKGKIFKYRNGQSSKKDNNEKYRYVEDHIDRFKFLTKNGLMLPVISSNKVAGGRISDSITLMPSWIRKLIKINGRYINQIDFTCLHPNLAVHIYGGHTHYLTHDLIANELGITKTEVKTNHLSFFNKKINRMRNDIIFDKNGDFIRTEPNKIFPFYVENEMGMMQKIFDDKKENGYKITTQKLFTLEVEIMTAVITKLNSIGIYVLYIYDALACAPKHSATVLRVMNETVLEFGVFTTAHVD